MPTLSKILAPVVFSAQCEDAARHAAALACRFGSELVLLHVYIPPWAAIASPEGYATPPQYDVENTLTRIREQLDSFVCEELRGLRVRKEVCDGDPAVAIVEFAKTEKCHLIVMPTHGYGPFRRFLLGSVTAKVLHDACCPVLTGPHLEHPPAVASPSFSKILCAVDLGPHSRALIEWAGWIAAQFGSDLTFVHVLPSAQTHLDGIYFDPQWRNDMSLGARNRFDAIQAETGTNYEIRIEAGDVPDTVRETAESVGANLLVIGRGHTRRLLGRLRANAYAILRESPCPVLTI
jgi:nucleotide-binding universal stress UspA family protein